MALTAADVLIETIHDWGVEVVFGLPGDGINGIMEALRKRRDRVRFIQVRHEEAAALMACGYAKFTGRLGVCLATSGPGGIHLLNGLYDAALDGQPVLAITGMAYHDLIGTHTQQDVALDRLCSDVAKYNQRIMGPAHVENVTDLACRTALAYRGVAHLTFPVDIQDMDAGAYRSKRNIKHHTSDVYARSARLPAQDEPADALAVRQPRDDGGRTALCDRRAVAYPARQVRRVRRRRRLLDAHGRARHLCEVELPIKIVIVKNNTLGQIKWEQMVFLGNPEYGCELQPMDFALFAQACGATGFTIESPEDCGRMPEEALATPGPVVVKGVVDPFEPPLPAKVTLEQAAKFAKSLLRGEPNRQKIALTVLGDRIRELV